MNKTHIQKKHKQHHLGSQILHGTPCTSNQRLERLQRTLTAALKWSNLVSNSDYQPAKNGINKPLFLRETYSTPVFLSFLGQTLGFMIWQIFHKCLLSSGSLTPMLSAVNRIKNIQLLHCSICSVVLHGTLTGLRMCIRI